MEWVGSQQAALVRAGARPNVATERGIDFSIVGANPNQTGQAIQVQESVSLGRSMPGFLQNLERAANFARGLL